MGPPIGIYRNGSFYLRNSNTIGFANIVFPFGAPGDQPIAGDWDGNGTDTIGVYRNGTFYLRNSNSSSPADVSFGLGNPGDVGIAGDWNGDGKDTTGVFRPSNGIIFLKNANTTGIADIALNYGIPGDKPLTAIGTMTAWTQLACIAMALSICAIPTRLASRTSCLP
jgi:hypothetical protein